VTLPRISTPWAPARPGAPAYWRPGRVVVKMMLGEAPEKIPSLADVRHRGVNAAKSLDGGVVDRICEHFGGAMSVAHVHAAAAGLQHPGKRSVHFDDREQVFGLARTFRIDMPHTTPLGPLLESLNEVSTVERATPDYVSVAPFEARDVTNPDDVWSTGEMVHAAEALAYEPGDSAVIVAFVDSGVAPDHPELDGRLRSGFDTVELGKSEFALGIQLLGDNANIDHRPIDRWVGHGTACAGIIGAVGKTMMPGLAGDAQLLPMRGLGAARFPGKTQPVGIGATTDLDMAMKMAVDLGAKVINMSFGTDDRTLEPGAPKPHADVVAYALDRGVILVAASGNNGERTLYWPAAYPGVIAVGAVDASGAPTSFSTRGDHVALCAPGERVFTLALQGYQLATGTSFAAPFVTAVAALLVARSERRACPIDGPLVRTLVTEAAQRFASGADAAGCGAGILDASAALRALDTHIDQTLPDDPGQVEDG